MEQTPNQQRPKETQSTNLSNEQLTTLAKEGDKAALALLWEQNKGLLHILCKRYFMQYTGRAVAAGLTWEDIEQEGYFIICKAVRLYRSEKAVKFITLLPYIVRNHLQNVLGIKTKQAQNEPLNQATSLDLPIDTKENANITVVDVIPDISAVAAFENVEHTIFIQQLHNDLERAFLRIEPKQAAALRGIYYNGYTIKQLAEILGCTPDKVQALQTKGLADIRRKAVFLWKYAEEMRITNAYRGTGFAAWEYRGSVQERIVERIEQKQTCFAKSSAKKLLGVKGEIKPALK